MYATPFLSSIPVPSSPSKLHLLSPTSGLGSRRKIHIKASTSTLVEPIPIHHSCKTASLYEILKVKQTASQTEIKTAYRSLAKLYHPDAIHQRLQSDGIDFMEIHNAYETLSDPAARALYDLSLGNKRRRATKGFGFTGGYCPTRRWETDQCW